MPIQKMTARGWRQHGGVHVWRSTAFAFCLCVFCRCRPAPGGGAAAAGRLRAASPSFCTRERAHPGHPGARQQPAHPGTLLVINITTKDHGFSLNHHAAIMDLHSKPSIRTSMHTDRNITLFLFLRFLLARRARFDHESLSSCRLVGQSFVASQPPRTNARTHAATQA